MDVVKNFGLLALAVVLAIGGAVLGEGTGLMALLAASVAFSAQVVLVSPRNGTLVAAALAAGCNAYLLSRKFATSGDSACNINQTLNCDAVNMSAASEMFGIPITLFGLAFYGGLVLAGLIADRKDARFDQISGLFAILNLGYSAYLGWESKQLGAVCVVCITIYACNGLLLWASLAALKQAGASLFAGVDRLFGTGALWTLVATFAVTTLVGASMWQERQAKTPGAMLQQPRPTPKPTPTGAAPEPTGPRFSAEQLRTLYARPQGRLELLGNEPVYGDPSAPIEVVEFADYGCPHCAEAVPQLKQVIAAYPQVQLKFKAFPLSGACNPALEGTEGVERCKAAMAAKCAGKQGKYFELSTALFTNMGYRSDEDISFMAQRTDGLDHGKWLDCVNDPATIDELQKDAIAGVNAGVQGTPTLYVKGLVGSDYVEITQGPLALQALVEAKLDGVELLTP